MTSEWVIYQGGREHCQGEGHGIWYLAGLEWNLALLLEPSLKVSKSQSHLQNGDNSNSSSQGECKNRRHKA